MNTNIYKKFRGIEKVANRNTLSKRFDEPTYFSFRLIFGSDSDNVYNIADNTALYDTMPHPLFDTGLSLEFNKSSVFDKNIMPLFPQTVREAHSYSAVQYLLDANEPTRAELMNEFIIKFNELQNNFPYYFQSIEGVGDLLKINYARGQRIQSELRLIITCLEGLDLRMSYLLNLYRKIAWDDVYQRWVLPDMMRYFTLKIYLAEFRTFHLPQISSKLMNGLGETNSINSTYSYPSSAQSNGNLPMYLTLLDDILPTWEITCEMCEFDISDTEYVHLENLNVNEEPEPSSIKFKIKVGNIKELQTYPMFTHKFLSDRKINGLNRSKDIISTLEDQNNKYLYPASLKIAQAREKQMFEDNHVSGLPYNEMRNSANMFGQGGPGADSMWGTTDDDISQFSATQPSTWTGNAINFGTAYAKSFVNRFIDKGKITTVPGLGVSFNEVKLALEAKNVIGALGLIRKGINEVIKEYGNAPSERLDQPLQTDNIMKHFLNTLSNSEATDSDTTLLKEAAGLALSDKGIWEKIKDFSLATDLIGTGEINIPKNIQSAEEYQQIVAQQSQSTLSFINQSLTQVRPNSASGKINDDTINLGSASDLLSNDIKDSQIIRGEASEKIGSSAQGNNLSVAHPSERLFNNTEPGGPTMVPPSDLLGNKTPATGFKKIKASSQLSSNISGKGLSNDVEFGIKTTKIDVTDVIENIPSTSINKKIEGDKIKQPLSSKATTNNKIEK